LSGRTGFLALDVGTRKIGIAFGQPLTGTAQALTSVPMRQGEPDWAALDRVVQEWIPAAFVLGLPRTADGREGAVARLARRLGARLVERYARPVHYADERLTSAEAAHRMAASGASRRRRERNRDAIAAQLILESFLNRRDGRTAAG
jgi:putative Holliday junction resolvase